MKKFLALALAVLLVLTSVTALAQTYTDKETVKAVQEALNAAGYPCGVADGIAGVNTTNAIITYQATHGLPQTGAIDDALLISLGLMEDPSAPEGDGIDYTNFDFFRR